MGDFLPLKLFFLSFDPLFQSAFSQEMKPFLILPSVFFFFFFFFFGLLLQSFSHPRCFTCSHCGDLLADLRVHVDVGREERDRPGAEPRLFCGRHWAENRRERCDGEEKKNWGRGGGGICGKRGPFFFFFFFFEMKVLELVSMMFSYAAARPAMRLSTSETMSTSSRKPST